MNTYGALVEWSLKGKTEVLGDKFMQRVRKVNECVWIVGGME